MEQSYLISSPFAIYGPTITVIQLSNLSTWAFPVFYKNILDWGLSRLIKAYQGPYLYYFWIYGVHAFIWNDFSPTKTWGSSNSFGYSFWTILPFENPFGCNKIAKKYQTSWHTRSTKPNKPSRLISPPDQPEPSDATDPQDPPEPSSQLWRFSHNFTIVNLLLPKLLPTAHGWEQGAR